MSHPRQGEVWWAEAEDERRPVPIVTRPEAFLNERAGALGPARRIELCLASRSPADC